MDTEMPSVYGALSESSKHNQPKLTKITLCLHSPNYFSFAALIYDDRDELEFSFS